MTMEASEFSARVRVVRGLIEAMGVRMRDLEGTGVLRVAEALAFDDGIRGAAAALDALEVDVLQQGDTLQPIREGEQIGRVRTMGEISRRTKKVGEGRMSATPNTVREWRAQQEQIGQTGRGAPTRRRVSVREAIDQIDRRLGNTGATLRATIEGGPWSPAQRERLRREQAEAQARLDGPALSERVLRLSELYEGLEGRDLWPRRVGESVATTGLYADVLGPPMHRRMLRNYVDENYGEWSLAAPISASDFRTHELVQLGKATIVPTVLESGEYLEGATLAQRGVPAKVVKHGRKAPCVTIEMVANDDLRAVDTMAAEEGAAHRKTLATAIVEWWNSNPTLADGEKWFAASRGNLGALALDAPGVLATLDMLRVLLPFGGTTPQGLPRERVALFVPPALEMAARALNSAPGTALYGYFGVNAERIVVSSLLTSPTDWGAHLMAPTYPSISVLFLDGKEEPEFAVADTPNAGQLLLNDRIEFRSRHIWDAVVSTPTYAVKNVTP
jgi:hypothetical protein